MSTFYRIKLSDGEEVDVRDIAEDCISMGDETFLIAMHYQINTRFIVGIKTMDTDDEDFSFD